MLELSTEYGQHNDGGYYYVVLFILPIRTRWYYRFCTYEIIACTKPTYILYKLPIIVLTISGTSPYRYIIITIKRRGIVTAK